MYKYLLRSIGENTSDDDKMNLVTHAIILMAIKHRKIDLQDFIVNELSPDIVYDCLNNLRNKGILDFETDNDCINVKLLDWDSPN